MRDLFDRLRGDLDFDDLAIFLEDYCNDTKKGNQFARQVRDLRDRLQQGVPVAGSDLDAESFLAYDLIKQIREITLCPNKTPLIHHIENMCEALANSDAKVKDDWQPPSYTNYRKDRA